LCHDCDSGAPTFPHLPPQLMEDLEQLKVLENGYKIKVIVVDHCAHGVDEPHDIASIEEIMRKEEAAAAR